MSISTTPLKMSASCSVKLFEKALGSKRGILRAGYFVMPMDETLGLAAVDFCGRTSTTVDTKFARGWSVICKRSWFMISSKALRGGRTPACMPGCSTAAPAITRLNRCSRLLREHCARHVGAIAAWLACCPARRDCCDDRSRGLSRRESYLGEKGARPSARGRRHHADPEGGGAGGQNHSARAWVIFRHERLEREGFETSDPCQIQQGVPFLGICVGLQWMFESSTEAPGTRAWDCFWRHAGDFPPKCQIAACRLEFVDCQNDLAACCEGSLQDRSFTSHTRTVRLWCKPRWHGASTAENFPPRSNKTICSACNFIRKNRA